MPQCREDDETETLELTLRDELCDATLKLYYTVFPFCDVIARHAELINGRKYDIRIERIGSLQLDLPEGQYDYIGLGGGYWRERDPYRLPRRRGRALHHEPQRRFEPLAQPILYGARSQHYRAEGRRIRLQYRLQRQPSLDHHGRRDHTDAHNYLSRR